jgi:hypothetical protein
MAAEKPEIDFKSLDRRVASRLVRRGVITEKELEKAAKTLADSADKATPIESQLTDTDED